MKVAALALLLISISLFSSFLNSRDFSKTGFKGFIGSGFEESGENVNMYSSLKYDQSIVLGGEMGGSGGGGGGNGGGGGKGSGGGGGGGGGFNNLNEEFNPPTVPIFFVEGLDNRTNYLRLYTASEYKDGVWIPDKLECGSTSVGAKSYKVTPIVNLTSYLPVAKDTHLIIPGIFNCYDPDRGVYSVKSSRERYVAFTSAEKIKPGRIIERWSRLGDDEIRALAEKITENATGDYDKVKAVEEYLKKNYENTYIEPPKVEDPVKYFLFESKKGSCREFSSAFVFLLRSLGIPARVVFGYLADPTPRNQTVYASDAYVWAEVKFENGWIEFDPTPGGELIETRTNISYVDEKIIAGRKFHIIGNITSENKKPVSGFVEIYFKENKNDENGILVGILYARNGTFSGNLTAPNVTGEYSVVAHYTGSFVFNESWSDPEVKVFEVARFNVSIPDRIPTEYLLKGRIVTINPVTGNLTLCVDNDCSRLGVRDGVFSKFLELREGKRKITLKYEGGGYVLPSQFSKDVRVCRMKIEMNESYGEGKDVRGKITLCNVPFNGTVVVMSPRKKIAIRTDGNFSIPPENLNLKLGRNIISFFFPKFGMRVDKTVFVKRKVEISYSFGDKLTFYVRDVKGVPADGYITLYALENGRKEKVGEVKLADGRAEFDVKLKKGIAEYSGSDKYFPSVVEVKPSPSFPYPVLLLATLPLAYLLYRRRDEVRKFIDAFGVKEVFLEIVREYPDLPCVWERGEEIKVRAWGDGRVRVKIEGDGERVFENAGELTLKFDEYGDKKIILEVRKFPFVKRKEERIRVAPYSEGIAEVFKLLIKEAERRGHDVESMTPREIVASLNLNTPKLLINYEKIRYGSGLGKLSRRDFVEAFEEYLKLRSELVEDESG